MRKLTDCGAGKDARTTNSKVVEMRMPLGQGAVTAPLPCRLH
jgi:hypothetical protein